MSRVRLENLPAVKIPVNSGIAVQSQNEPSDPGKFSACFTPDSIDLPLNTQSSRLPDVNKGGGIYRVNGYAHPNIAVGSPNILQRIFAGQLPPSYFNELCYGRRATPREYLYRTPTKDREKELWEPKSVSREKTRHVIRDIQDARFRRQSQLEQQSVKKGTDRFKRGEAALMREADVMSRGLQAYLLKLSKERQKYENMRKKKYSYQERRAALKTILS